MEKTSVVVFIFAILFGIGSVIAAIFDWINYGNYGYLDFIALLLFVFCEILGIVAIPLAFVATQAYLYERNARGVAPGPCFKGWHIAAWIVYGISIAMSLACTIVGFLLYNVSFFWLAVLVVLWAIAWGLMMRYTSLARRRQSNATTTSTFDDENNQGLTVSSGHASVSKKAFRLTPVPTTPTPITDPTEAMEDSCGSVSAPRQGPTLYASAVKVDPNTGGYLPTVKDQCQTIVGEVPWTAAATASSKPSGKKRASTLDP